MPIDSKWNDLWISDFFHSKVLQYTKLLRGGATQTDENKFDYFKCKDGQSSKKGSKLIYSPLFA